MSEILKEALDETTPSERLRELLINSDRNTRIAVAKNPNTPPDVLFGLFQYFPIEVSNNPVLDFLLVENPNFICELCQLNINILASGNFSQFFFEAVLSCLNDTYNLFVATNPHIPEQLLFRLADNKRGDIRIAIAKNTATRGELLKKLARDELHLVREVVAKQQNTPSYVLEELAKNKYDNLKLAVAKNPNTPIYILANFSKHKNENIRSAVAINPNTPLKILETLAHDKADIVRLNLAKNPNTQQILKKQGLRISW